MCRTRRSTDDNTIRRMRFACRITKDTDAHSEYVILIAFPRQQLLRERTSVLRLYVYCLFCIVLHQRLATPPVYTCGELAIKNGELKC
jgi:hypothetical protein